MAKQKIDFKSLGTKAAGLAMGTMGAGFVLGAINKITNSAGQPALNDVMQGITLIGVGAFAPGFIGQKNPMIGAAGDAVMVKGVDMLLRKYFPNAIKGVDDAVAGDGDYEYVSGPESVNDLGLEEAGVVAGPEYDEYDEYDGLETQVSGHTL